MLKEEKFLIDKILKEDYAHEVTWSRDKGEYVKTPIDMIEFFRGFESLCKKYNLTLSHEDGHGGFEIEPYDEKTLRWIFNATDCRVKKKEFEF